MNEIITNHLDLWTSALLTKSSAGRGSNGKLEAYGIKKLRELILELAVRGKLVPQDPNDEPASVLLKKIANERARLAEEGRIRQEKLLLEIDDKDAPYMLPAGWAWTRLPNIASYKPGKTPSTKNPSYWSENSDGVPWVSISDMEHLGVLTETAKRVSSEAAENVFGYEPIPKGSLLMSFKLTVGKMSILGMDAYHNEAIISIQPHSGIERDYLLKVLPSRAQAGNTKRAIMGDTLNATSLALLLIPVPPLAEQHRIVAKVDELMALCDQLEQQQTHSLEAHQTLVETLLGTLARPSSVRAELRARRAVEARPSTVRSFDKLRTNGSGRAEFEAAWTRIATHFDTLFTTEHSIDQLKQTILQLAVMGKLVPQDPNDEPASVLLNRIAAERTRLVEDGEARQKKELPDIGEDETPYVLPNGWEWVRLGQIISISSGDGLTSANMNSTGEIPVYGGNGVTGYHDKANVTKPTLVIGRVGYYCGSIHITPESAWVTDNAFVTTFSEENIYLGFLYWLLRGTNLKENENATAQPVISGRKIYPIVIGLPPKREQRRIVAKVDELMALCDALKARLKDAQTTQLHLADAIVEQAVA